jgi:hypothetical protein
MEAHYDGKREPYHYATKTGDHVLVQPFNMTQCSTEFQSLVKKNPLMLWGY